MLPSPGLNELGEKSSSYEADDLDPRSAESRIVGRFSTDRARDNSIIIPMNTITKTQSKVDTRRHGKHSQASQRPAYSQ